jgi:hypothetical protein
LFVTQASGCHTATRGIVSAIRQGAELGSQQQGTWIQVDAALSPGNSGGPLINASGQVVGMSTLASQGTAQNLNFGISVRDIAEALQKARTASTMALATGVGRVQMGQQGPVLVAGTATAQMSNGMATSVTVLQLVAEEQLRQAVQRAVQPSDSFRTWSDRKGSFSVEAQLLGKDATKVVLQRRDGTIVNVPRDKLSDGDLEFVRPKKTAMF